MKSLIRKSLGGLLFLTAISTSTISFADDAEKADMLAHGEEAHQKYCYKCHTDDVYTREDHFVKSIDALKKQVVRCKDANDIPWFDEDVDAVVQFLNTKYYKF
jgi:mono/diheme cytochrome c family protein